MENKEFDTTKNTDSFDLMTTDWSHKKHHFKKKKHGIAAFFDKIGRSISNWWKGLKKWQKIVYSTLTAIIALILVLVIVFFSVFGYNYNNITGNPDELGFENVIDKKVINVALFGVDTRSEKSFKGNSDSIMVLSINTETKTVKIVSIMRDSLVVIDRNGKKSYNKINGAYAGGGPELAIKTINQNFGLDISEYATVNFYGMAEIIDAVGGIDAELTKQEVSTNHADGFNGLVKRHCNKLGIDPEPYYIRTEGKHHLNGIQAVAYSRIRKFVNIWGTNNDFGRTDRQRYVMEQLFNKALTLEKTKYVKLVKALIPYTETSLSYSEIMGLAFNVLLHSPKFEQSRMPLNEYQMKAPSIPRVGSCVYYDLDFAKDLLHAFFYDNISPEDYVEANGIRKNDWYTQMKNGTYTGSSSSSSKDTESKVTSEKKEPSSKVESVTESSSEKKTSSTSSSSKPAKKPDKNSSDSSSKGSSSSEASSLDETSSLTSDSVQSVVESSSEASSSQNDTTQSSEQSSSSEAEVSSSQVSSLDEETTQNSSVVSSTDTDVSTDQASSTDKDTTQNSSVVSSSDAEISSSQVSSLDEETTQNSSVAPSSSEASSSEESTPSTESSAISAPSKDTETTPSQSTSSDNTTTQ